jgi:DNA-binding GntR family transcriptional regulator
MRAAVRAEDGAIQRKSVVDVAVEALRSKILHGEYREGQPLRQEALASDLGVSRIPIREALRQLEAEGLVSFSPNYGAVVSTLQLTDIEELFDLRAILEADLIRRAVPQLTDDDLARADAILDAYDAAFESGDIAAWGALNWDFHSTLLSAANRPVTMGVLQTLHNQSERYMRMQLTLTHGEMRASHEHHAILQSCIARDARKASTLVRGHVRNAGRSLVRFLHVQREREATRRRPRR